MAARSWSVTVRSCSDPTTLETNRDAVLEKSTSPCGIGQPDPLTNASGDALLNRRDGTDVAIAFGPICFVTIVQFLARFSWWCKTGVRLPTGGSDLAPCTVHGAGRGNPLAAPPIARVDHHEGMAFCQTHIVDSQRCPEVRQRLGCV